MSTCSLAWIGITLSAASASPPPEEAASARFHGPRLPAEGERPVQALGLGGGVTLQWVGDPTWSPQPYSGGQLSGGISLETWHVDRLDRVRGAYAAGSLWPELGDQYVDGRAISVETFRGYPLTDPGPWTLLLGWGTSWDGALREGIEESFDAWGMAELGAAARWVPPRQQGRWVLDATLKLPALGVGLRPFAEIPYHQLDDARRLNWSALSWHNHASVGWRAQATRFLSNGNALYAAVDWRGRWSWADPALARVGGGLELGLLWAAGGW